MSYTTKSGSPTGSCEKRFSVGMYGGKFMPMHTGHLKCLDVASRECESVYLILFVGGNQEDKIHNDMPDEAFLTEEFRIEQIIRAAQMHDNVYACVAYIGDCRNQDGSENWDAETPMVLDICQGEPSAVYGSEPSYAEYFKRAYPNAEYRMIDPERKGIPISATKVRAMDEEERKLWMV